MNSYNLRILVAVYTLAYNNYYAIQMWAAYVQQPAAKDHITSWR